MFTITCGVMRVGLGYDSHRFADAAGGAEIVLGGVSIAQDRVLLGHSDNDVVLHAVTDAILGAVAAGDIGQHFPETDDRWAGADSSIFVAHALNLAAERNCRVGNCDVTIITESPKIAPHRDKMQQSIALMLGVEPSAVSVKAKTNEGMGAIGAGEGIAAFAVVCLVGD